MTDLSHRITTTAICRNVLIQTSVALELLKVSFILVMWRCLCLPEAKTVIAVMSSYFTVNITNAVLRAILLINTFDLFHNCQIKLYFISL